MLPMDSSRCTSGKAKDYQSQDGRARYNTTVDVGGEAESQGAAGQAQAGQGEVHGQGAEHAARPSQDGHWRLAVHHLFAEYR